MRSAARRSSACARRRHARNARTSRATLHDYRRLRVALVDAARRRSASSRVAGADTACANVAARLAALDRACCISVIVPFLDEAAALPATLAQLARAVAAITGHGSHRGRRRQSRRDAVRSSPRIRVVRLLSCAARTRAAA